MIEPGVYGHLPIKDYHSDPALSHSMMEILRKSPAHLETWRKEQPPPTPAMVLGSAFHCLVLEPRIFKEEDYPIPESKMDTAIAMAETVRNHSLCQSLLSVGLSEVSYFWQHSLGFIAKCRPDHVNGDTGIDLKSTADASPEGFAKSIANFGYHRQGDMIIEGVGHHGEHLNHFLIIAVEKSPPYAIAVYRLSEDDLYLGHLENQRLYEKYAGCLAAKSWPGYPAGIQSISIPQWAIKQAQI